MGMGIAGIAPSSGRYGSEAASKQHASCFGGGSKSGGGAHGLQRSKAKANPSRLAGSQLHASWSHESSWQQACQRLYAKVARMIVAKEGVMGSNNSMSQHAIMSERIR